MDRKPRLVALTHLFIYLFIIIIFFFFIYLFFFYFFYFFIYLGLHGMHMHQSSSYFRIKFTRIFQVVKDFSILEFVKKPGILYKCNKQARYMIHKPKCGPYVYRCKSFTAPFN